VYVIVCVCLLIVIKSGRYWQWIRIHWIPMVQISGPLKTIPSHDWTCIYERGIDLFSVKWVFMDDGIPNSLRCFVVPAKNHSTKRLVQDLEFFENVRNLFPLQPWAIFARKLTWELGSCVQKMAPVHCQSCCFRLKGEGPQSYAFIM
jgi:hypothetical protein